MNTIFVTPSGTDYELLKACNAYFDLEARLSEKYGDADIEQPEPMLEQISEAIKRLVDLRAVTLKGHQARAKAVLAYYPHLGKVCAGSDPERSVLAAILRDLAGGAV